MLFLVCVFADLALAPGWVATAQPTRNRSRSLCVQWLGANTAKTVVERKLATAECVCVALNVAWMTDSVPSSVLENALPIEWFFPLFIGFS